MTQIDIAMRRHNVAAFDACITANPKVAVVFYFTQRGRERYQPHAADTEGSRTCAGCGETAAATTLPRCSCEVERYCSAACQHRDWARHKALCQLMRGVRIGEQRDRAIKLGLAMFFNI